MKIFITIPSLRVPHGGTRIIITWAEYLLKYGHTVTLFVQNGPITCDWYNISTDVTLSCKQTDLIQADCIIICSPHSIHLQRYIRKDQKCFIFLQMIEHYFRPGDKAFYKQCIEFYMTPHPVIHGSVWNERIMRELGRTGPCHYVGNGVNLNDFPISDKPKDGKLVLVEGWECTNPAKDIDNIGPKVAARLKAEGYKILAYSQLPLKTMPDVPDEYYQLPSMEQMNDLYERATILIKASRYDARAVAPMEAMTKGTVTVRAIVEGDDDLLDTYNCYRCAYDETSLYDYSMTILADQVSRHYLSKNCLEYIQKYTWDYWMDKVNDILTA